MTAVVTDGADYDSKQFLLTVGNVGPKFADIADKTMHWRPGTLNITLPGSDANADPLVYSAVLAGTAPINLSVTGNVLTATLSKPWTGTVTINATVSDGAASDTKAFKLTVTNTAPALTISSKKTHFRTKQFDIPFTATDANNDPLTTTATTANAAIGLTVLTNAIRATFPDTFVGIIPITVTTTDSVDKTIKEITLEVANAAPVLTRIPDQSIHFTLSEAKFTITASDPDGDPLTLSSRIVSTDITANLSLNGNVLTVSLPDHKFGTVVIENTATDGHLSVSNSFKISTTNNPPKFRRIDGQYIPIGEASLDIDITAVDPDNDPLTYSVRLIKPEEILYELDQRHNFELRFGDYFYNLLGNNEKYVQGTKNEPNGLYWYVIYPNGDFFEWRGKLSESPYYGRIPTQYYENPSLLFDVPSPDTVSTPATLTVSGSVVTAHFVPGFIGQFLVRARVTDGVAEDVTEFAVEVFDPTTSDDTTPGSNGCDVVSSVYEGEFPDSTHVSSFTAEARIGNTLTAGTATHEMDVSRSVAGPFAAGESANFAWQSGAAVPFSLVYDPNKKKVTWTLDRTSTIHLPTITQPLSDLLLRARSAGNQTSVKVQGLTLNRQPVGSSVTSQGPTADVNVLQISTGQLNVGFILEGTLIFDSAGAAPKDSELALQITATHVNAHATNCIAYAERKIRVCHLPNGNPDNMQTIWIGRSMLTSHLGHGDYVGECPGKPVPVEDETQMCDLGPALQSPAFAQWNTVIGMTNTLELANRGVNDLAVKISVYGINGQLASTTNVTVRGRGQSNIPVESLPGYVASSQGLLKLEYTGTLDGRMIYRRSSAVRPGEEEFVFAIPLADPMYGETAVAFNTTQPSTVTAEKKNRVMNWLSVTNLDSEIKGFQVATYNNKGKLFATRRIEVAPLTRMNLDGGHDLAGPGKTGIHVVTPLDINTEYIAELTRFGGNNKSGTAASEYRFAVPFTAQLPQSDAQYLPITRKANEVSWVEVSNVTGAATTAAINLFNTSGKLIESINAKIPARGQTVVNSASFLKVGESGYAQVIPKKPRSLITDTVVYYLLSTKTPSVTSAYSANGRRASACLLTGGYNIENGLEDWLLVSNTSAQAVNAVVTLHHPSVASERIVPLKARSSTYIPVHDPAQLKAPAGSSGILYVRAQNATTPLFSQIVRQRRMINRVIDFTTYVPMR